MPNWCSNSMTIEHESLAMIDRIEKGLQEGKLLETLRPLPNGEWDYGWCIDNWGTKWEVDVHSWNRDGNSITFNFDSAWGPPIEACEYAESEWKYKIRLYYIESGMCFMGSYEYGVSTDYEYPNNKKDVERCLAKCPDDMNEALDLYEYFGEGWFE